MTFDEDQQALYGLEQESWDDFDFDDPASEGVPRAGRGREE